MKRLSTRKQLVSVSTFMCIAIAASHAAAYSWQEPHAEVIATGDLRWAPQPFVFVAGNSQRYIDYDSGNDANAGTSRQTAWKHHPWDPAATGNARACTGIHTYIFKRGVNYFGKLS